MRRIFAILMLLLGVFAFERADITPTNEGVMCEVVDMHHAQLVCNNRHNIDIEHSTSVVVPTATSISSNIARQAQQRLLHLEVIEQQRSLTNYPITHFIHRLGTCARAVDFYLYILCQLRL